LLLNFYIEPLRLFCAMKTRILIIAGLGVLMALWITRSNLARWKAVQAMDTTETIRQQRSKAKGLLLAECTNSVTGINRIIDVFVDDSDASASKWKGRATVEYINSVGGVDRTNLQFIFITPSGNLFCMVDPVLIDRLQVEAVQHAIEEATNAALNGRR
jgi:hypothetical protein